jgi:hypothetical protein
MQRLAGLWALDADAGVDWRRTAAQFVPDMVILDGEALAPPDPDLRNPQRNPNLSWPTKQAQIDRAAAATKRLADYYLVFAPDFHRSSNHIQIDFSPRLVVIKQDGSANSLPLNKKVSIQLHGTELTVRAILNEAGLTLHWSGDLGFMGYQRYVSDGQKMTVESGVSKPWSVPPVVSSRRYVRAP